MVNAVLDMIASWLSILALVAALGCGLIGGVFFAFSNFVMKALARLPAAQGAAAMQSINVVVLNLGFLAAFMGTAVVCLILAIASLFNWSAPGTGWLLAGSLLYIIGTFMVTMVFNVPRNNALAAVASTSAEAAQIWAGYLKSWTAWNHVRTAAAVAAAAVLTIGLWVSRIAI
jgi:uncharacterized membrane protein